MIKNILKILKNNYKKLSVVLAAIVMLLFVFSPKKEAEKVNNESVVKTVNLFKPSDAYIETTGKVVESNVIEIKSQVGGIVSKINFNPGDQISTGQAIISIANNYTGANAANVQSQIATNQYKLAKETYDDQISAIDEQKDLAILSEENSQEQRKIAEASLNDTNKLVESAENSLSNLKTTNTNGSLDEAIAAAEASLAQLKASQRSLSYSANGNEPPAKIAESSKELSLKQIEIQKKSLDTQLEVTRLSMLAAQISASNFNPAPPMSGVVENINVGKNQTISPSQTIATIRPSKGSVKIIAYVPSTLYPFLDSNKSITIEFDNKTFETKPNYISTIPVDGFMHAVHLEINNSEFTSLSYVNVKIPFSQNFANGILVPLSALHQTQTESVVYIQDNEFAKYMSVEVGSVQGDYVQILSGLDSDYNVIVSRNISEGDLITISN